MAELAVARAGPAWAVAVCRTVGLRDTNDHKCGATSGAGRLEMQRGGGLVPE